MSLPKIPFDPRCDWHVLLAGQRLGPYTRAALHQMLETHPEGWEASVWRPGMLDWRPAQRVEALAEQGACSPSAASAPSDSALPRVWAHPPRSSSEGIGSNATIPQVPREVAVFMQTPPHARRAPPEFAETTRDMPTFKPAERQPLRTLGFVLVLGGLVALSAVLVFTKLSATSAPKPVSEPASVAMQRLAPAEPAPTVPMLVPQMNRNASALSATRLSEPARPVQAVSEGEPAQSSVKSVRIRSHWAPVRVAPDPSAKVLCSLQRGTVLPAFGERPGTRARWFAVRCDSETPGWVHENFLASLRR